MFSTILEAYGFKYYSQLGNLLNLHSSFQEKNTYSMTMFYTDDAKTLFGENGLLLGDFTLKVIGEMKLTADGKSGHWVCSCGIKERGIVVTRSAHR